MIHHDELCEKCRMEALVQREGRFHFYEVTHKGKPYFFNVQLGYELARRLKVEILEVNDRSQLESLCSINVVNPGHLDHVDPTKPGLIGLREANGSLAMVFIDGSHRAARCLRDGLTFRFHLLSTGLTDCLEIDPEFMRQCRSQAEDLDDKSATTTYVQKPQPTGGK